MKEAYKLPFYLSRFANYLKEMFPPINFFLAPAFVLAFYSYSSHYFKTDFKIRYFIVASLSFAFFGLLIRMMDEIKDAEVDRVLFPERPLPRGLISENELLVEIFIVSTLTLLINFFISRILFTYCLAVIIFSFFMFKWFFFKKLISKSLPLALLTHHPIVILQLLYLLASFSIDSKSIFSQQAFFILPHILIFTHWEVARKIKPPEKENSYTTYSKILGFKTSLLILVSFQTIVSYFLFRHLFWLNSNLLLVSIYSFFSFSFLVSTLFFERWSISLKKLAEAYIIGIILFSALPNVVN